jgi:hypothetical protein
MENGNPHETEAYWANLTKGHTTGLTSDEVAEVARRCVAKVKDGNFPAVWHEAATLKGTRCCCAKCMPTARFC